MNQFGDKQLLADVMADTVVRETLLQLCPEDVGIVSSEETPVDTVLTDARGYSVAYDPLDGSSIIGSNFAVGSIFGVWKGRGFLGKNARDMAAAVYAVYGPRTVLIMAFEDGSMHSGKTVCEFTLLGDGMWKCTQKNITLKDEKKLFAPANLRASKENGAYADLMQYWMQEQYTLRYTGGMVPDIHNIIHKVGTCLSYCYIGCIFSIGNYAVGWRRVLQSYISILSCKASTPLRMPSIHLYS